MEVRSDISNSNRFYRRLNTFNNTLELNVKTQEFGRCHFVSETQAIEIKAKNKRLVDDLKKVRMTELCGYQTTGKLKGLV